MKKRLIEILCVGLALGVTGCEKRKTVSKNMNRETQEAPIPDQRQVEEGKGESGGG